MSANNQLTPLEALFYSNVGEKQSNHKNCIGWVIHINYETAEIFTHDHYIKGVNYVANNSFLLAKVTDKHISENTESTFESNVIAGILMRVVSVENSVSNLDHEKIKTDFIKGFQTKNHDPVIQLGKEADIYTRNELSFHKIICKIIGTFYLD